MADHQHWGHQLALTGHVRVFASRWRMFGVLLMSLVFVAGGVFMARDGDHVVAAWLCSGFFGLGVLVSGWRLVRPVTFVVSRRGIRYGRCDLEWGDLTAITEWTHAHNRMVVLLLTDDAAMRLATTSTRRALMRADAALVGVPNLGIPGPFARQSELVAWLENVRATHAPTPGMARY
ncbi:STM3941 family protein [Isoptericola sp. NPDC055881]